MANLQATKDTFYTQLRDRIAAANPARTIPVRGTIRPAVLVIENEIAGAALEGVGPAETFCLRWLTLNIDAHNAGQMIHLGCEVRYACDGSAGTAGFDRGRGLAAMDQELTSALATTPLNTPAFSLAEIAGGGASTQTNLGFNVFWSEAAFAPVVTRGGRLERTAQVEVFGYGQ